MWRLSATPEIRDGCFRGWILTCLAHSDGAEVRSCLAWHLLLFLLCSGVLCPDTNCQLLPTPQEWWKIIFLKGSNPPTHSCCSASRSGEIWSVAELPAVLDTVWEDVWSYRSYISSWLLRSHVFGALGAV